MALPQRSPTPLMVPWTWLHPSATAAMSWPRPVPSRCRRGSPGSLEKRFFTTLMISISSLVRVPPLVSGIDPNKDVDAFHPVNVGRILIGNYAFLPCTPAGCQELIYRAYGDPKGKEVVVVGRSNIVGKPMVAIMIQKRAGANATVTCVHTGTPKDKMIEHCRRADILIVAAGVPNYIQADWVKEGVCVIDVGVNRIGMTESGKAKLAGDVDFAAVSEKASFITPVPGGVGPMTITMLMKNTVMAAKLSAGLVKL